MSLRVVAQAGAAASSARLLPQRQLAPATRPDTPAASAETVFQTLDGRELTVLGRRWRLEVFSVLELAGQRYVQLSADGPTRSMITLRMRPVTDPQHAIPVLVRWLARPARSGEVLDVEVEAVLPEGQRKAE